MSHLIVKILNNPFSLGTLCFLLVMVPIIGISKIHDPNNKTRSSKND
jgi:hypothetical protein